MTTETKHTIAWCAGLFEGEGWICAKITVPPDRPNRRFQAVIGITNTDVLLLAPFAERWGGRIRPRKGTALSRKPLFEWRIESFKADRFLREILPYLRGLKKAKVIATILLREQITQERLRDTGKFLVWSKEEISCREKLVAQLKSA